MVVVAFITKKKTTYKQQKKKKRENSKQSKPSGMYFSVHMWFVLISWFLYMYAELARVEINNIIRVVKYEYD